MANKDDFDSSLGVAFVAGDVRNVGAAVISVVNEAPLPAPPPPEPPPAQIGDVVMVKGEKYGKITDIKGGEKKKYTIQEVSVDVVNAILGTKLK
mgnify:CR=1 FL=1